MNSRLQLLSIVVPVCNEATNIAPFYAALAPILDELDLQTEIIFVDDGSTDASCEAISALGTTDHRIRMLRFSRNFGSHAAILAGLRWASGDAAVIISADLQDPPTVIPELVHRWRKGFHVVWAVREGRDDPWLKKSLAGLFYWLFRRIALPEYPASGMDFGLFDRCVLDSLQSLREVNHFVTGMIVWLGFRQTQVPYYRHPRRSGLSKWPIRRRIKGALDAIVSFSYVPIRWISYIGLLISFSSLVYAAVLLFRRVFFGLGTEGWPSLMVAVLFLGGTQLIVLGILGEYIWRGADQVKGRPQYIVMDMMGWPPHAAAHTPNRLDHHEQQLSKVP